MKKASLLAITAFVASSSLLNAQLPSTGINQPGASNTVPSELNNASKQFNSNPSSTINNGSASSVPDSRLNPSGSNYNLNPNANGNLNSTNPLNPTNSNYPGNLPSTGTNPAVAPGATNGSHNVITEPSNLPTKAETSFNDSRNQKLSAWTDDDIAQKIRWAVQDDKKLSKNAKAAEINVKNGSVTLTGSVNNNEEKAKIADIAKQTRGVKSISNNLTIAHQR